MGVMGLALARYVHQTCRDLWKTDILPSVGSTITLDQGLKIQKEALAKVKNTMQRLSPRDQELFRGLSPQRISVSQELFRKILYIADRYDLDNLLELSHDASLNDITAITQLSRSHLSYTHLPASLGNLTSLTQLTLTSSRFTSLPESFGSLSALTHLILKDNNLSSLPEHFGNLSALIELDLSNNLLSSLPPSFVNLSHLRTLDISHNPLDINQNLCRLILTLSAKGCKTWSNPPFVEAFKQFKKELEQSPSKNQETPPSKCIIC
jgi:Leucine-rich repeat (LRR) protein